MIQCGSCWQEHEAVLNDTFGSCGGCCDQIGSSFHRCFGDCRIVMLY